LKGSDAQIASYVSAGRGQAKPKPNYCVAPSVCRSSSRWSTTPNGWSCYSSSSQLDSILTLPFLDSRRCKA